MNQSEIEWTVMHMTDEEVAEAVAAVYAAIANRQTRLQKGTTNDH